MVNRSIFSSASVEWPTPKALYEKLHAEFDFTFDPCPYGGDVDGTASLFCSWDGHRVFCNPPYGPGLRPFLERWSEPTLGVYLLPARTDVKWFHEIVLPFASEVRFLRGRLKFGDATNSAPFPSMIVVFRRDTNATNPNH